MRYVTSLPHEVREDEHVWVPLSDGTRLAARVWRPVASDDEPVPAVLEYIPYRKRDITAYRDSMHHPYMAGHGYACVRVDLRGSGESEGTLTDEYLEQELSDGEEVLAWLAAQPWCTGRVGMMGISWGGFNSLQLAARKPPELGAIIAVAASDDRYLDDVHYMGGCLLGDNLSWASTMFAYNSCPPEPALVGERWRDMWFDRLEHSGLWVDTWLRHQRYDDYWAHGSVREDYSTVSCPVMAVSGWADGYSNAVFRLLSGLQVPKKGLIGPWSHKYPHLGQPGPAIGFLQEVLRWWDHWLKDIDTGTTQEPVLRMWMQESEPPSTGYHSRPGRWIGEWSWPSPNIETLHQVLAPARLADVSEDIEEQPLTIRSPLSVGQFAGKWASFNAPPDLPYDQREEDGGSLVFETDPLPARTEICGAPVVDLDLETNKPVGMLAVRLSDVLPDGQATRVSYGLLNLTHRNGHDQPEPLEPGERYKVRVHLNGVAQVFPAGHRIRVSVSTSYWPLAWPPPEPVLTTVYTGSSELLLPVRPPRQDEDDQLREFGEPEASPPIQLEHLEQQEYRWTVLRELARHESALEIVKDPGTIRLPDVGLDYRRRAFERYSFRADEFDSVRGETEWRMSFRRGDWSVDTVTRTVLTCTPTDFHLHATLDAYEDDERVFSRNWSTTVPRDHV